MLHGDAATMQPAEIVVKTWLYSGWAQHRTNNTRLTDASPST
jgi:hypothetical protein